MLRRNRHLDYIQFMSGPNAGRSIPGWRWSLVNRLRRFCGALLELGT
jgi:hypothetical protein